jgi:hypothetical protein
LNNADSFKSSVRDRPFIIYSEKVQSLPIYTVLCPTETQLSLSVRVSYGLYEISRCFDPSMGGKHDCENESSKTSPPPFLSIDLHVFLRWDFLDTSSGLFRSNV